MFYLDTLKKSTISKFQFKIILFFLIFILINIISVNKLNLLAIKTIIQLIFILFFFLYINSINWDNSLIRIINYFVALFYLANLLIWSKSGFKIPYGSYFGNHNSFGATILYLTYFSNRNIIKTKKNKLFSLLGIILLIASRSTWIALAIGLLTYLIYDKIKRKKAYYLLVLGGCLVFTSVYPLLSKLKFIKRYDLIVIQMIGQSFFSGRHRL